MNDPTTAFTKMVPGFDFLQGLVKSAGAALPQVGQWIAPTLDPEELDKRIQDLRTVQYWLEQNARLLGATIQALEVQRMTLSTLKTMNVSLGDLTESLKIRMPGQAAADASADDHPAAAPAPRYFGAGAASRSAAASPAPSPAPEPPAAPAPAAVEAPAGVVDPMQWWSALTQQFTQLAASAMQDSASDAARNLAGNLVKQGLDAAGETFKKAAGMPAAVAQGAASVAQKMAGATAHKAPAKTTVTARTAAHKTPAKRAAAKKAGASRAPR